MMVHRLQDTELTGRERVKKTVVINTELDRINHIRIRTGFAHLDVRLAEPLILERVLLIPQRPQ